MIKLPVGFNIPKEPEVAVVVEVVETKQPQTVRPGQLSSREQQVYARIMLGEKTPAIAEALKVSTGSVKVYKQRIYQKLNVKNVKVLKATYA